MCNWVNKSGVVTIVLFVFCVVFFSCEEISFGKDQDTAEMLCNRVWVDFYDEDDYTECRRELSFYLDGTIIIIYIQGIYWIRFLNISIGIGIFTDILLIWNFLMVTVISMIL